MEATLSDLTDHRTSPWHAGEIALQTRAGVADHMAAIGPRVIRPFLTDQHRLFYPELPFVVLGGVDPNGDVWATIRAGAPGFLHAPDPWHLAVTLPRDPADPAEAGFTEDAALGLLGIQLETRRRNRLNGWIRRREAGGFLIEVEQSFGNCPKYIHTRTTEVNPDGDPPGSVLVSDRLETAARLLIERADTFFVASYVDLPGGPRQVDVSHRGGPRGFVRIDAEGRLTIPDFSGNRFFNTLGNIAASGHAGLVFFDGARGDLLQIAGDASVDDVPRPSHDLPGVERLWQVTPRRVVFRPKAIALRLSAHATD